MFEHVVTQLLRFTIWLLDEQMSDPVWKERISACIPKGLWDAYCSFHEVDKVAQKPDSRKPISDEDEHLLEAWHHS